MIFSETLDFKDPYTNKRIMYENLDFAELKNRLKKAQKDKKRWLEFELVFEMGDRYIRDYNYNAAAKFFGDAIELADDINYKLGVIESSEKLILVQRKLGEWKKARKLVDKVLAQHEKWGNKQKQAENLLIAAFLDMKLGDFDKAIDKSNMAMFIYQELNNLVGKAECLNSLGEAFYKKGETDEAILWLDNCIENSEIDGDMSIKSKALSNKGKVYFHSGKYKDAFTQNNDALSIDAEFEYTTKQAVDLNNLGLIYKIMDQNKAAHQALNNALNLLDSPDNSEMAGIVTQNLTEISKKKFKEKHIKKLILLSHPKEISRRLETEMEELMDLGDAYLEKRNFESAMEKYQEATKKGIPLGNSEIRAKAIKKIGIVHKQAGRHKHALNWFNEARKIKSNINEKLDILGHVGDVFHNVKDLDSALGWHNRRFKAAQQLGDSVEQGISLIEISKILLEQAEPMKATKYLLTALEQYEKIGHIQGQIDTMGVLATAYEKLGDRKSALKYKLERDKLIKSLN
mgnify:CR=1 FL=1